MENQEANQSKIEQIVFTKGKSFVYVPELVNDLTQNDCQVLSGQLMFLSADDVRMHYAHVAGEEWFPKTLSFYAEHPVFIMDVYGSNEAVKSVVGEETDPHACALFSFRAQKGNDLTDNAAHRTGKKKEAPIEVDRFFGPEGIVTRFRKDPLAQLVFQYRMFEYLKKYPEVVTQLEKVYKCFGNILFL